uniref:Uncharacterized protein n=1 Tax=Arundo donax TaxID=35708 RepID=A0A0A9DQ38_ARUDO
MREACNPVIASQISGFVGHNLHPHMTKPLGTKRGGNLPRKNIDEIQVTWSGDRVVLGGRANGSDLYGDHNLDEQPRSELFLPALSASSMSDAQRHPRASCSDYGLGAPTNDPAA